MGKIADSLSHGEPGGESPALRNRKSTRQAHTGWGWVGGGAEGGSAPRRRPALPSSVWGTCPDGCSRSIVMIWGEEEASSVISRRSLPRAEVPSAPLPATLGSANDQSCPRQAPFPQMPQARGGGKASLTHNRASREEGMGVPREPQQRFSPCVRHPPI